MRRLNPLVKAGGCGLVVLAGLIFLLPKPPANQGESLVLYCAASLRAPAERAAAAYEEETGVRINLQFGGSNTLLSQLEIAGQGDLYLAADKSFVARAREKGLLERAVPVAQMRPVVGVAKGNPLGIRSTADLSELRIAAGSPAQTAIGQLTRALLVESNGWDAFDNAVRTRGVYKPTVADVANDLALGTVDAGVLWDAVAAQYPEIDVVVAPELAGGRAEVAIGVLRSARDAAAAERFVAYLIDPERGAAHFAALGYPPVSTNARGEAP